MCVWKTEWERGGLKIQQCEEMMNYTLCTNTYLVLLLLQPPEQTQLSYCSNSNNNKCYWQCKSLRLKQKYMWCDVKVLNCKFSQPSIHSFSSWTIKCVFDACKISPQSWTEEYHIHWFYPAAKIIDLPYFLGSLDKVRIPSIINVV